jgi:hypothetical protein
MGVAKDATRSLEDVLSTPIPGETLAMFYARSSTYFFLRLNESLKSMYTEDHWTGKATEQSDNRGKMLRRDGFALAQARYGLCFSFSTLGYGLIVGQGNTNQYSRRLSAYLQKRGWMRMRFAKEQRVEAGRDLGHLGRAVIAAESSVKT